MLLVATLIALVSAAAGFAPLAIQLDVHRTASAGAGVILGTALVLVIPEGVSVLYAAAGGKSSPATIGVPLLAGFLLMATLDGYFRLKTTPAAEMDESTGGAHVLSFSLSGVPPTLELPGPALSFGSLKARSAVFTELSLTTLGMIIHSAADGVALGAAYALNSPRLRGIVALSIIVHKSPAAFSLTNALQAQGVRGVALHRDILLFALAAPLAAILTHMLLGAGAAARFQWWAGVGLMFSGGTFVFVAVHILPPTREVQDLLLTMIGAALPVAAGFIPE